MAKIIKTKMLGKDIQVILQRQRSNYGGSEFVVFGRRKRKDGYWYEAEGRYFRGDDALKSATSHFNEIKKKNVWIYLPALR